MSSRSSVARAWLVAASVWGGGLACGDAPPRIPARASATERARPEPVSPEPAPQGERGPVHASVVAPLEDEALEDEALEDEGLEREGLEREGLDPWAGHAGPLELTFVGDVILGRYRDTGYDPIPDGEHEVFAEVAELLRSDLVVGNLETPLVRTLPDESPIGMRYRFGADAALAQYLRPAGFDALSLANNHAYDMRAAGVQETPEILAELGITALGAVALDDEGSPYRVETMERQGWRIGFIAITTQSNVPALDGVPPLPLVEPLDIEARIVPLVEEARVSHDLVVVLLHWGQEYAEEPDWLQQMTARALIEAGADLVIGHHPHVLQGIERHGHGLIAYSLGNFSFENVKEVPRQTGVLRVRYDSRGCMEAVVFHPAFIKSVPIKHPVPATGYMGQTVRERMRALSSRWQTRFHDEGDDLVVEVPRCPAADRAPAPGSASP